MTKRKSYPTDLSEPEWEQVKDLLPQKQTDPEKAREYLNAIVYLVHSGCSWRMLPHDFPPWPTVSTYFRKLIRDGTWERINDALRERVRQEMGREAEPSVVIVASQSVKTTEKGGHVAMMEASE
jgi:putative transposase